MQKYSDTVLDRNGNVVVGATVAVTTYPAGVSATVYSANTTSGSNANPLTTDSNGYFEFWAPNGRYSLTVSKTGISTRTVTNILIQDPAVTVTEFGAVGDGVTDDSAAIQAALNSGSAVVVIPKGTYRLASAITIPAETALVGMGYSRSESDGGVELFADLAVTPVITMNGGGRSSATQCKNIFVSRASGSIPANSIGILVSSSNAWLIEDCKVYRSDIAYKVASDGVNGRFERNDTVAISSTHLWLEGFGIFAHNCRFGSDGGADVACNEYVRIKGGGDTYFFNQCHFNLSAGGAARWIYFDTYSSPNGIINFVQCHVELVTTTGVAQTGTTSVSRLVFNGCTIDTAGAALFTVPAAFFSNLTINDCPEIHSSVTIDQCSASKVVGNTIDGNVLLNKGSGTFVGNNLGANLTVQGACTGLAVLGNTNLGAATFTNTATGTISCDIENTSFVPVLSTGAGTLTSAAATMKYTIVSGVVNYYVEITVTTNGTGATNLRYTLPYTPIGNSVASGMEDVVSGNTCAATWSTGLSKMVTLFYNNSYPGANGAVIKLNGRFSSAV